MAAVEEAYNTYIIPISYFFVEILFSFCVDAETC